MTSAVFVQVPDRRWAIAEFCIDDECVAPGLDEGVTVPVGDELAEYRYHLVVVNPEGEELTFDGTVATTEYRVNGAGCDPVTANAVIVVHGDGTVAVEALDDGRR